MNVRERIVQADLDAASVQVWLGEFESALACGDAVKLTGLFQPDGHWRDALALTWNIQTVSGSAVVAALNQAGDAGASGFALDTSRTPPRLVTRAGTKCIEAIFKFETTIGRGSGVVRLIGDRAWTLFTALDEIKGFEERTGKRRPTGQSHSRDFRGPNWLDQRNAAVAYTDRDPDVLVVGGGQAGLSIAARLKQLNVDALIIDREQRIGDNWRNRYHALTLHQSDAGP